MDWGKRVAAALPHPLPRSNNKLLPLEKALAFMQGLLCDARKLTHVAYLRREWPEISALRVMGDGLEPHEAEALTSVGMQVSFQPARGASVASVVLSHLSNNESSERPAAVCAALRKSAVVTS